MTFINFAILGGIAAVSIPVLIHLFNRSRFRVVNWGAMHLLESVIRVNRRRMKLEQIILLLIRCAIPVALALCMARPVMTGWRSLVGDAPTSHVTLLDNSYSMEAGGAGQTRFQQAVTATQQMIAPLKRGSDAAVILMAGQVRPLTARPTFDLKDLALKLGAASSGYGAVDTVGSLEAGIATLSQMEHAKRDLVLLSDFQRSNWATDGSTAEQRVRQLIESMPVKPTVTLFKVGSPVTDNVCVESMDFSRMVVGVGQELRVKATLRNYGRSDFNALRVYFRVDGTEQKAAEINLPAGEDQQVLFTHTFERAGSHVIEVYADADALKADNVYRASIAVWDRVPALLVSGQTSDEPLKGETDFLEVALQPFTAGRGTLSDLIDAKVVSAAAFDPAELRSMRVVVLANVPRLNDGQLAAVRQFVADGGGLLIFPGDQIDTGWYNGTLGSGPEGLLPLPYAALAGDPTDPSRHARVIAQHYDHPALTLFNDRRNGELSDGEIRLWYKLNESSARAGDADALTVLARLDTADPLLVEKKVGEGRVIQCATPCDADWSNLPMRPFYLPLMQQVVTYLASTVYPPRNVDVGRPLIAFVDLPAGVDEKAVLTDPSGVRHHLSIKNLGTRGVVEFDQTTQPGLYILEPPSSAGSPQVIHFVVNTSRTESALDQLDDKEIDAIAQAIGADVVRDWEQYRQLDATRRHGREIWKMLLWTVLGLVFVELLAEQWFAGRSS